MNERVLARQGARLITEEEVHLVSGGTHTVLKVETTLGSSFPPSCGQDGSDHPCSDGGA